jgi:hypothetical protein
MPLWSNNAWTTMDAVFRRACPVGQGAGQWRLTRDGTEQTSESSFPY